MGCHLSILLRLLSCLPLVLLSNVFLTIHNKERKLAIEFQDSVGHPLSLAVDSTY